MSHLLFVESNTTGTGGVAVERLLAAGDSVTFLTRSREKYPFLASTAPRLSVLDVDTNDVEAVVTAAAVVGRRATVDAVLTFSDFYVAIVAEAAARLGFRYLSPAPARTCRNKALTRQALAAAGLPTPRFRLVASVDAALACQPEIGFPCVVKPPTDSSSFGVRVVRNAAELADQARRLGAMQENVRGQRLDGSVLVESYLDGPEYSIESFTLAGGATHFVGVTDKHLSPHPHCVEVGHDFPSAAEPGVIAALAAAAAAALAAVGFDLGPAHTEIRWTHQGPVVIEVNPRLAGGMIPELVRYATGIDLLDAWLALLLGRVPDLAASHRDFAAIRFLTCEDRGRLAAVTGVERARAFATIRQVVVDKPPGTRVQPSENAYHRLGFVIGAGTERPAVGADVEAALRCLRIEVVPESAAAGGL